jgi:hypothetical protein
VSIHGLGCDVTPLRLWGAGVGGESGDHARWFGLNRRQDATTSASDASSFIDPRASRQRNIKIFEGLFVGVVGLGLSGEVTGRGLDRVRTWPTLSRGTWRRYLRGDACGPVAVLVGGDVPRDCVVIAGTRVGAELVAVVVLPSVTVVVASRSTVRTSLVHFCCVGCSSRTPFAVADELCIAGRQRAGRQTGASRRSCRGPHSQQPFSTPSATRAVLDEPIGACHTSRASGCAR